MSDPFVVHQRWEGTTAHGRPEHSRVSTVHIPGKPPVPTSVAPDYQGHADRLNPEDLFGAALSTCMMYTFLSLARKARVDVRAYDDTVEVFLVTEDKRTRIERAVVRPVVTLAPGAKVSKAQTMFDKSHKYCIIANSTTAEVVLQPTFEVLAEGD